MPPLWYDHGIFFGIGASDNLPISTFQGWEANFHRRAHPISQTLVRIIAWDCWVPSSHGGKDCHQVPQGKAKVYPSQLPAYPPVPVTTRSTSRESNIELVHCCLAKLFAFIAVDLVQAIDIQPVILADMVKQMAQAVIDRLNIGIALIAR